MAKKTSERKKANYAAYQAKGTARINKEAKLARHAKKHPNDRQSAMRAKPTCAGVHKEKRSPLTKRVKAAVAHHLQFGNPTKKAKVIDTTIAAAA